MNRSFCLIKSIFIPASPPPIGPNSSQRERERERERDVSIIRFVKHYSIIFVVFIYVCFCPSDHFQKEREKERVQLFDLSNTEAYNYKPYNYKPLSNIIVSHLWFYICMFWSIRPQLCFLLKFSFTLNDC